MEDHRVLKEKYMPKQKKMKNYELCDGPKGVTAQSCYYGKYSRRVYYVRAYSIKQAYLLAGTRVWSFDPAQPGISKIEE